MWAYYYPVLPARHRPREDPVLLSLPMPGRGLAGETAREACLDFTRRMLLGKESPFAEHAGHVQRGGRAARADAGQRRLHHPGRRLPARHPRAVRRVRLPADRRRDPGRHGPDRPDVGLRARARRAGHDRGVQGPGQRAADLRRDRRPTRSPRPGARARTSARSPPPRWPAAASNATLDVYESRAAGAGARPTLAGTSATGSAALQERHPILGWIDARGLFVGLEFVRDRATKEPAADESGWMLEFCVREGLLFEKGGYYYNRFQLIPALVMEKETDRPGGRHPRPGDVDGRGARGHPRRLLAVAAAPAAATACPLSTRPGSRRRRRPGSPRGGAGPTAPPGR